MERATMTTRAAGLAGDLLSCSADRRRCRDGCITPTARGENERRHRHCREPPEHDVQVIPSPTAVPSHPKTPPDGTDDHRPVTRRDVNEPPELSTSTDEPAGTVEPPQPAPEAPAEDIEALDTESPLNRSRRGPLLSRRATDTSTADSAEDETTPHPAGPHRRRARAHCAVGRPTRNRDR